MDPATWAAIIGGATELGGAFFSKHMSDTAHQREVRDLAKAGINPLMTAQTRGAPMPDTPHVAESVSKGVSSALAVRAQRAQLGLIEAQRIEALARSHQSEAGAKQIEAETPLNLALKQGDIRLRDAQALVAEADVTKVRSLLPFAVEHMLAEIRSMSSSAQAASAEAELRRLMQAGALNESNFQKSVGAAGPWGKVVLKALQTVGAGALGGAMLRKAGKGITIINKAR